MKFLAKPLCSDFHIISMNFKEDKLADLLLLWQSTNVELYMSSLNTKSLLENIHCAECS